MKLDSNRDKKILNFNIYLFYYIYLKTLTSSYNYEKLYDNIDIYNAP